MINPCVKHHCLLDYSFEKLSNFINNQLLFFIIFADSLNLQIVIK